MTKREAPHKKMTEKSNGLSSAQEVLYQEEFKRADHVAKGEKQKQNEKPNL